MKINSIRSTALFAIYPKLEATDENDMAHHIAVSDHGLFFLMSNDSLKR